VSEIRHVNLYRWAVAIVVACLVAGVVEIGIFVSAVHKEQPNWDLEMAVNRVGIVTSLICTVAGVVGARQKPTLGISELGVVIGFLAFWLTMGIEELSQVCFICI
jgi:uncharacterized membrane protein HdeD (DUF308 family)